MDENGGRFALRPSRAAAVWLLVSHAGAVLALWSSAVPSAAGGVLTAIAAASLVRSLRLHAVRRANGAVVWIELGRALRIGFADGREMAARFRAPPFVHARLVVLRLASNAGRTVVLVPLDALPSRADHKALRRALRHGVRK